MILFKTLDPSVWRTFARVEARKPTLRWAWLIVVIWVLAVVAVVFAVWPALAQTSADPRITPSCHVGQHDRPETAAEAAGRTLGRCPGGAR